LAKGFFGLHEFEDVRIRKIKNWDVADVDFKGLWNRDSATGALEWCTGNKYTKLNLEVFRREIEWKRNELLKKGKTSLSSC
jgi:hypothetical protein